MILTMTTEPHIKVKSWKVNYNCCAAEVWEWGEGGHTEQRHVSVMVAVTQKLTGWRDVKGEIYQD